MSSFSFNSDEVFNLEKNTIIGGSREQLRFHFFDFMDSSKLDITNSTVVWTLSQFGDNKHTLLKKRGVLSGDYSCIIVLESEDTENLVGGKFIQQISLIDYKNKKIKPAQGALLIIESNDDKMLSI